jgi:hypothetical protein
MADEGGEMAETKRSGGPKRSGKTSGGSGGVPSCPISVCPVGLFLTFAGEARPEVVEHVLRAGRELVLAAAAFMNARAEALGDSPRLEKIEID